MRVAFIITLSIILYIYAGYPLIIALLALFVKNKVYKVNIEPKVTFLITAYNEEENIRRKLLNTLELDYPKEKLEIMVASDASSDNTDNIVRGLEGQRVKLFRVEGRQGKTEVQNRAVREAEGEIIIFSDATTDYEKSAIRNMVRNYADSSVGAVSGRYRYFDERDSGVGVGEITFWEYENFIKSMQTRIRTITGCCGCIYSVRKRLYVELPAEIISDLVEPLKILEQGYRIVFEPQALAYETTCQNTNEEFKMRIRVISRGMQGLFYMKKLFNPFKYGFISFQLVSHKVLRWFMPIFLAAVYISNIFLIKEALFFKLFFWVQSIFYFLAVIGLLFDSLPKKIKLFSLPMYFCVVNLASMVAFIKTLKNEKHITWNTLR